MSYSGDCCHYDDGYEDGLRDAKTDGMGDGLAREVSDLLLRIQDNLYAADPLSILALECDGVRLRIRDLLKVSS